MDASFECITPLPNASFGGRINLVGASGPIALLDAARLQPDAMTRALAESGGLLLIPGMHAIADAPDLLVRLSDLFGPEVEDYRQTLTAQNMVHATVPEIFVVSNIPPTSRMPPRRPDPPFTVDGSLPVQFPHRRGWHTDQSYRRPPPDISLFFAVIPAPPDQAQTLFADCAAAYEALPPDLKARVDTLDGIHVSLSAGRGRNDVVDGKTPRALGPVRAAAASAFGAHPSGHRQAGAVYVRVWADGLGRRSHRRDAARPAWRGCATAGGAGGPRAHSRGSSMSTNGPRAI